MRRARPLAVGALVALTSCSKPAPKPDPPPVPASAAASVASLTPAGPVWVDEVAVPGLRVRTGTIARGSLWGFSELSLDLRQARLEVVRADKGAALPRLAPPG